MVTMNREERALRSLKAVFNQNDKPNEIIVVDSSDTNTLGKSGKKLFAKSKIKFVYVHEKASMTEARNIGIRKSKNDIVLFIDDDVVLTREYIDKLKRFYTENPHAGGACGYLCDGNKFLVDRLMKFPNIPSLNEPFTIISLHGSNMSFRRKVFDDFMFHEGLKGYYADDDEFSARVSTKYKIYLVPYMKCVHEHTSTGGARLDPFTNFNTMMFNRYFIYRMRKKSIFNFLHYLFSEAMALIRIVLVYNGNRGRALSGAFRGYKRALRNVFKNDLTKELSKL